MSTFSPDDQTDVWERRLDMLSRTLFVILLAMATILAVLQGSSSWTATLTTVGVAGLVGAWMAWLVTRHAIWTTRRGAQIVSYAVLLAGIAVLLTRSPWFGLLVIPAYDLAFTRLPRGWKLIGIVATSALAATAVRGGLPAGLPAPTVADITVYVLTVALYTILGGGFTFIGQLTSDQSAKRKRLVAELAETNHRLELTMRENAGLHAQLLAQAREAGVFDERQRMAREIHDTLAQGFIGIIAQLEAAKQITQHPTHWEQHIDRAEQLARESLTEARRSVQALQPQPLENAHLPEAIADLAERWSQANTLTPTITITGEPRLLPAKIETTLFRVAQEALTNVAKHAKASKVGVTLSYLDDIVILDIRDDGIGFTAETASSNGHTGESQHFGLTAMRQRMQQIAGTLEIESAPGEGTAINASVPAL
ncbi:MAG TPA: sensor histidine kinase [Ktedonobacterales bacterium]